MITTWARDTLAVRLTVTQDDGTPLSLSGATVAAVLQPAAGAALAATVTVTDAAAGQAELRWAAGSLAPGGWQLQAWVTTAGETQTVADQAVTVRPSLAAP